MLFVVQLHRHGNRVESETPGGWPEIAMHD